jgi:hypothetical protein
MDWAFDWDDKNGKVSGPAIVADAGQYVVASIDHFDPAMVGPLLAAAPDLAGACLEVRASLSELFEGREITAATVARLMRLLDRALALAEVELP